jgi:hypothetical protein
MSEGHVQTAGNAAFWVLDNADSRVTTRYRVEDLAGAIT